MCIARANRKLGSSFTLRNVENGIAYEQKWELYSPHIQKIEVLELARRRRAKLYYMRNRPAKVSVQCTTNTAGSGRLFHSLSRMSLGVVSRLRVSSCCG